MQRFTQGEGFAGHAKLALRVARHKGGSVSSKPFGRSLGASAGEHKRQEAGVLKLDEGMKAVANVM